MPQSMINPDQMEPKLNVIDEKDGKTNGKK
jgi:hypothetical protein